MKISRTILLTVLILNSTIGFCVTGNEMSERNAGSDTSFDYIADRFADIQVLRYQVKGFENLSLNEKKLAYFLTQAGLSGRDIFYDQKNKNNLMVRKTLEAILNSYAGDKKSSEWNDFTVYCKRFFFANGMHHHYAADKMIPGCTPDYFSKLMDATDVKLLPLNGKSIGDFKTTITKIIFDRSVDPKLVDLSATDVIKASSNNFYENVSQEEVENYYKQKKLAEPNNKSEMGLNTKLVKENGKITEKVWKSGRRSPRDPSI